MTIKLTREEAISIITKERDEDIFGGWTPYRKRIHEAFTLAIEALEGVCFDEWCDDCKEYDTEKNCCPRFNRVIRGALKREPSEDGTLEVKVDDATKIGRVLISDDKHRGGLYYPDEYEPKGEDLISRAEAIEAITGTLDAIDHVPKWVFDKLTCAINILPSADRPKDGDLISRADAIEALGEEPPVWCDEEYEIAERDQWRADIEAIKSVPSADRQMVIKCKPFLSEEDFKAFAEQASDQNVILISNEAEVVSTNTSTKSTNISTDTLADTVELVRCKDCRHRIHDEERCLYYCEMYYGQGDVSDDNFCQWGAKMDGDMSDGERSEE